MVHFNIPPIVNAEKKLGGKNFQSNTNSLKIAQLNLNTSKFIILSRFCISSILLECKVIFFPINFYFLLSNETFHGFFLHFKSLKHFSNGFSNEEKMFDCLLRLKQGSQPGISLANLICLAFSDSQNEEVLKMKTYY